MRYDAFSANSFVLGYPHLVSLRSNRTQKPFYDDECLPDKFVMDIQHIYRQSRQAIQPDPKALKTMAIDLQLNPGCHVKQFYRTNHYCRVKTQWQLI